MRALVVDPSAYSPPYDEALCEALARAGAGVELVTSRFVHGERPAPVGYTRRELFYRRAASARSERGRRLAKLATHGADMRTLRRLAETADVTHLQWSPLPWLDLGLLPPRPRVLTVHNAAPRVDRFGRGRALGAIERRMDALVVHSAYGRARLLDAGIAAERVHVIPHGAFDPGPPAALPAELDDDGRPVVLMFGLLRPYKGLHTLLAAWRGIDDARLWIVGRPRMAIPPLPPGVSLVGRFVSPGEASALYRRADLVVLPYEADGRIDGSGVLASALGAGTPSLVSDVGGLGEIARATHAALAVPPGDAASLHTALVSLLGDPSRRARMASAARRAAAPGGPYSWEEAARLTLALYAALSGR